jgi:hypothetical protein
VDDLLGRGAGGGHGERISRRLVRVDQQYAHGAPPPGLLCRTSNGL